MAFCNLQLRRSFIILVFLLMLSSATDHQHNEPDSESSQVSHDVFNRTVVLNSASEWYLGMIFQDYSDNATGKISAARFKDFLRDLSLGEKVLKTKTSSLPEQESSEGHHRNSRSYDEQDSAFGEFGGRFSVQRTRQKRRSTEQSQRETKLVSHGSPARPARDRKRRNMEDLRKTLDERNACLEEHELMNIHGVSETQGINEDDFVRICPSLIRQLQKGACVEEKLGSSKVGEDSSKMLHVWGYGMLSITVISLTSLLAIAIIPLMGHSIYKRIMSFLVALAVGTLAGDALLHLIPHAFNSGHSDGEGHKMNIYKSCVIMAGIYVFFLVECTMKARLARRKRSQEDLHMCDEVTSPDKMSVREKKKQAAKYQEMIGSRLAGIQRCISYDGAHFSKASGHFSEGCKPTSCELVLVESGKEERASTGSESSQEKVLLWEPSCHGDFCYQRDCLGERGKHSFSDTELVAALQGKSCIHPNIYTNNNFCASGSDSDGQAHHSVNQIRRHGDDVQYSYPIRTETTTITTSDNGDGSCEDDHEHDHHHHHHHHHSHKIDKATSIATVAWMVIVGDGFHNFSDGLVVGAAFSASLTNGLTTAIAVFCHELPHELGDFAVLLKSGLTFRQALTYNLASAFISYLGLVLGIIIGDIQSAHTWVLALTAGMFLYISLVDMLPELSNYINDGGGWTVVLSQNMGILTGVSIMLVIALYES